VALVLVLAAAAAFLIARPPRPSAAADLFRLRIFYSTDFHGALEPCG
jgi:hypothetical protein